MSKMTKYCLKCGFEKEDTRPYSRLCRACDNPGVYEKEFKDRVKAGTFSELRSIRADLYRQIDRINGILDR